MADDRSANHVKPDGSVGAYNEQQILWTSSEGMGQNMHNILLRRKPFEDLGSIVTSVAGLNRPLVLISQDNGIYIYIYVLRHSVRLDHYVSGDQERKERLNIGRKKLCTV